MDLSEKFITRIGKREDCSKVFELYQELQIAEKIEPDQVIDENVFTNEGFGQNPCFEIMMAELVNGREVKIIGFALYFYHYAMASGRAIFVECLYIKPAYQNRGFGKQLWKEVMKVGLKNGCQRCMFMAFGWNKKAMDFYAKCGAVNWTIDREEQCLHIPKDAMVKFIS